MNPNLPGLRIVKQLAVLATRQHGVEGLCRFFQAGECVRLFAQAYRGEQQQQFPVLGVVPKLVFPCAHAQPDCRVGLA